MSARRKILIIDDSPLVLELTKSALESAGFDVSTTSTLDSFEDARVRIEPDLILVDVQMPEAFGDDLAATLRGAYGVSAPILLLSSLDEEELAQRAVQAEVTGWVSKKAGLPTLIGRVKELLGKASGT